MMRNACKRCKIYFPDLNSLSYCPVCGREVGHYQNDKSFEEWEWDRQNGGKPQPKQNAAAKSAPKKTKPDTRQQQKSSAAPSVQSSPPRPKAAPQRQSIASSGGKNVYSGYIKSYEPTDNTDLSLLEKLQLFFRGMHSGHTMHKIVFTDETDAKQYVIRFYGEIRASCPANPANGLRVTVRGRPEGNFFLTEDVYIGENGGVRVRLRNQHGGSQSGSGRGIVTVLIIMAVIMVICLAAEFVTSGGLSAVTDLVKIYLTITVLCFLAIIMLSRRRNFRTGFVLSMVLGAVGTALLYNVGDIRTLVQDFLGGLAVPALMIGGIILCIRSVINPR